MDEKREEEAPEPQPSDAWERKRAEAEAFRAAAQRYSRISARLRRHPR